jgi:hypothetical protein
MIKFSLGRTGAIRRPSKATSQAEANSNDKALINALRPTAVRRVVGLNVVDFGSPKLRYPLSYVDYEFKL